MDKFALILNTLSNKKPTSTSHHEYTMNDYLMACRSLKQNIFEQNQNKILILSQQGIASLLLSLVFIMYFSAMTKFLKFLKQRQVCCF